VCEVGIFSLRFYFVYHARDILLLYRRIMELTVSRSAFKFPAVISAYLLARICGDVLVEVRSANYVLNSRQDSAGWLHTFAPSCVECQWFIHAVFISLSSFLTETLPMHFAVCTIVPLTAIFRDLRDEILVPQLERAPAHNGGNVQIQNSAHKVETLTVEIPIPRLVCRFEEIASCFVEYGRIYGPSLFLGTILSAVLVINFIASLGESHLGTAAHVIFIGFSLSTLVFVEIGSWVHAVIEDCQDDLRDWPGGSGRQMAWGPDSDRSVVARMIYDWKWKLCAARGFFVIDRSLYATVSTTFLCLPSHCNIQFLGNLDAFLHGIVQHCSPATRFKFC
jgi:hypothetical protein